MYLLARLGDERFAFPVETAREVARSVELAAVPGAPPSVRGVYNLRGEVVPVVDLGAVLGVRAQSGGCVVVVEDGGRRAALAVDELLDVGELEGALERVEPPLLGSTVLDGRIIGVVDVRAVLDAVEGA